MNERLLYDNWKSFATESGLKFETEDLYHAQGIISNIKLINESKPLLVARIGKTGTMHRQEWTKVLFENNEVPEQNLDVKISPFDWLHRKSELEKEIQKTLKTINATGLKISKSESYIKFNYVLFDDTEIKKAIEAKTKIRELLTQTKMY